MLFRSRVYTAKDVTEHRIYTLQQNPAYRNAVSTKGYTCSKYTDYFLGHDMKTPPTPNITLVGVGTIVKSVKLSATAGDGYVDLSWKLENFTGGVLEIMRDLYSDPAGRGRIAYITNGATNYTDTDVENGTTYYYWIKTTVSGETINSDVASATPKDPNATGLTKCGAGSSFQTLEKGEAINAYCFTWTGANTIEITGMPEGIVINIDNANKRADISGFANDEAGEYEFTVKTIGGNPDSTRTGKITILSSDPTGNESIISDNFNIEISPNPVDDIAEITILSSISYDSELIITNIYGVNFYKENLYIEQGKKIGRAHV